MNDAVFTEGELQIITGRFMYGPLDMVTLAGEKVDTNNLTSGTRVSSAFVLSELFLSVCMFL